jgi:hypothetical protein
MKHENMNKLLVIFLFVVAHSLQTAKMPRDTNECEGSIGWKASNGHYVIAHARPLGTFPLRGTWFDAVTMQGSNPTRNYSHNPARCYPSCQGRLHALPVSLINRWAGWDNDPLANAPLERHGRVPVPAQTLARCCGSRFNRRPWKSRSTSQMLHTVIN